MDGRTHRKPQFLFDSLPTEIMEKILGYLSYDEISNKRMVCRRFNTSCKHLLNQGFLKVERFHAKCMKEVKKQLPRRESERRSHPMSRHCEVLTSIETRLSLLGMTFTKYIEMNLCCFIPGKVIDEIYRVLWLLQKEETPPRTHEILQELRDISSMAMEHFDERIAPGLKPQLVPLRSMLGTGLVGNVVSGGALSPPLTPHRIHQGRCSGLGCEGHKFVAEATRMKATCTTLQHCMTELKTKLTAQNRKVREQERSLREQARTASEQSARVAELEGKLSETNRKLLEHHRQFADLMAELAEVRDRLALTTATATRGTPRKRMASGQFTAAASPTTEDESGPGAKRRRTPQKIEALLSPPLAAPVLPGKAPRGRGRVPNGGTKKAASAKKRL